MRILWILFMVSVLSGQEAVLAATDDENWDQRFRTNGINRIVNAIAITGHEVYVGGSIASAGSLAVANIAKWDGTNWAALGDGVNALVFSWPATGTNFVLEATDNLPGTNWSEVSQPAIVHDNQCVVTNQTSGMQKFYRLRRR